MNKDVFRFFLYRTNKEFRYDLFSSRDKLIGNHDAILQEYLSSVANSRFDVINETKKSIYSWAIRNHSFLNDEFSSIVLARSQILKEATIVTSDSLSQGESKSDPHPADTIVIIFYWPRHLAIVENRSGMTTGETWLRYYHHIIDNAKTAIDLPVVPRLEPIPLKGSIRDHLKKFDKIFRLRLKLSLPNPEMNRAAKLIYDEMLESNISEYIQEFYSPEGVSVKEGTRIDQSAAMAELGYKQGPVKIDGEKDGKPTTIDEGKTAIKGKVEQLKSFIRGLETNAKGKNYQEGLSVLKEEVERLFPGEG